MKIYADKDWQDTGLNFASQSSKYLVVRAAGEWNARAETDKYGRRNANGLYENTTAQSPASTQGNTDFPYSEADGLYGQLIGRIGSAGKVFAVNDFCIITNNKESSNLWLRINDDNLKDNSGSLEVTWSGSDGGDVVEDKIQAYDEARRKKTK